MSGWLTRRRGDAATRKGNSLAEAQRRRALGFAAKPLITPASGGRRASDDSIGCLRRKPVSLRLCASASARISASPRLCVNMLLAALLAILPAPLLADTLIDNINGISLDRDGKVSRFTAMTIDEQGRIVQVYRRGDDPPRADYRENGRGRTVVPGMIDAHAHVMALGLGELVLDLTGTRSLDEALARLAAYVAANPERPWIVGRGWNQELWGLGRFPTAAEIDAVVGDRPVWLERVDGHAGWANSAALTTAGVSAASADPAGGRIERIAGGRQPAGVLIDAAMELVSSTVPAPRANDRDRALHEAQELLIRHGVTAVADDRARETIRDDLDRTLIVEAAAGRTAGG